MFWFNSCQNLEGRLPSSAPPIPTALVRDMIYRLWLIISSKIYGICLRTSIKILHHLFLSRKNIFLFYVWRNILFQIIWHLSLKVAFYCLTYHVVQMCRKVYLKFLLLYLDFVNLLSISKTKVSVALPL